MTLNERFENWNDQLTVDLENHLVLNVALAGQLSRNGYEYSPEALAAAVPLYESKPVFLDHSSVRGRPLERSTRDLVGSITNPRFVSGRIRGDIRVLETESGQMFLKLVESRAPNVGMSHVVLAERSGDGKQVQKISDVLSVDVVINPATTRTFTESMATTEMTEEPSGSAGEDCCSAPLPVAAAPATGCPACPLKTKEAAALREERDSLVLQIEQLKAEVQLHREKASIRALIADFGLPAESLSECFQQQLLSASTDEHRRQLLQDRMQLVAAGQRESARAVSQERAPFSARTFVEDEFVRVLKRRRP